MLSWGKGLPWVPEPKFLYRKIKHCAIEVALDQMPHEGRGNASFLSSKIIVILDGLVQTVNLESSALNPYKPSVLFVGHRQIVETRSVAAECGV